VNEEENVDAFLDLLAEEQRSRPWTRGRAIVVGLVIGAGSVAFAILAAVTGTTNKAGLSAFEIIQHSLTAFAIAMVVLMIPILLFAAATPEEGRPITGGRAVAISVASLILGGAVLVVDFVVWALLALTLDPPSDDA
jgi:hypothetical protein